MRISACNILKEKIVKITRGAVNAEVTLELQGGGPGCFYHHKRICG
jgi:molybdopterin-binding protein